jgi:hypothetical protein
MRIDSGTVPSGRRFNIMGSLFICGECFDSLGFEKCINLADMPLEKSAKIVDGRWEAFEAAYEAIEGRRLICWKCLSEIENAAT